MNYNLEPQPTPRDELLLAIDVSATSLYSSWEDQLARRPADPDAHDLGMVYAGACMDYLEAMIENRTDPDSIADEIIGLAGRRQAELNGLLSARETHNPATVNYDADDIRGRFHGHYLKAALSEVDTLNLLAASGKTLIEQLDLENRVVSYCAGNQH